MRTTVVACFVFGWLILLHMQKCLWYWSACRGGSNREAEVDGSESDHRFQTCGLKIQTKSFDSWLDPDRWPTLCHEAFIFTQKRTQPPDSSGLSMSLPSHRDSFKRKKMSMTFTNEHLISRKSYSMKLTVSQGPRSLMILFFKIRSLWNN